MKYAMGTSQKLE